MRTLVASLCLAAALAAVPAAAAPRNRVVEIDRIVAIVNDSVITESELDKRLEETRQQLAAQKIEAPPEDVLQRQLLERIVLEEIQLQLAAQTGIRVTDQDIERAIRSIAERNNMRVEELFATVRAQGFDRSAYREQLRKQIAIQQLVDREISSQVFVSESEVNNFLENARGRERQADEYNLSHIYIPVPESASAEQIASAKTRAAEVRRQLQAGEDFAQLAVTYSQGADALKGGALGWKTSGQLPELFVAALDRLQPGQVSEVLRGPNGFHLLRLNERRGGGAGEEVVQQTRVRHILLRPSEILSLNDARERLQQLKQQLAAGEDFTTLARTHSDDTASAANGGDLGWVGPKQLVPAFEQAMSRLAPGEISDPVQTPFGVHLIQVLERREQAVTGERERAAAREQIHARKADDRYEQWVRRLRDEAYVEYLLEDLD